MRRDSGSAGTMNAIDAKERAVDTVVFCQHGLSDPLVATLILDYVRRSIAAGDIRSCLFFTEEPPDATIPSGIREDLQLSGIQWSPLYYDVRGAQWVQKVRNVLRMLNRTRKYVRGKRICRLIGFLSFGGTYALLAQWLGFGRAMVICFEPHSRYMIELGAWGKGSLKARVVGWLERRQMRDLDALVVPTSAVKELVRSERSMGRVVQQATTIDVNTNIFDPQARERLRLELGFGDSIVLAYVGKFGGIYHSIDDYLRFLNALFAANTRVRAYIITGQVEKELIMDHPIRMLNQDRITVRGPVGSNALHAHLSAADIGAVAIPPTPSQAYRTPVKTAHYWAAGLPILIPHGVSDDHAIATAEGVGIVVKDLVPEEAMFVASYLEKMMDEDRDGLRRRCMDTAFRYRDSGLMVERIRALLPCA